MASKSIAFAVLVIASAAAAAGGAYVALRQNAAPKPVLTAVSAQVAPASTPAVRPEPTAEVKSALVAPAAAAPASVPNQAALPRGTAAKAGRSVPATRPAPASSRPAVPGAPSTPPAAHAVEAPSQDSGQTVAVPAPGPDGPMPPADAVPPSSTEPQREAAPASREFVELTVPADSVLGLQLDTTISSSRARIEDIVEARVSRDVRVNGAVAIPAGSRAVGVVTLVDQGGRLKNRPRIGLRFHTLHLADGSRVQLTTDTIYREGDSPTGRSSAKIGGAAIGGAILGAILGGGKGAAVGSTIGAAGGTAAVMAGDRPEVIIPSGTVVTARLQQAVTVIVEK